MDEGRVKSIDELFDEGAAIDEALKKAVRDALLKHKKLGNPIVVWDGSKVVWIPPEEIDLDDASNEVVVTIHWHGGRHTELRVSRVRSGRYPEDRHPSPVEVIRKLGGQWPDREVAEPRCRRWPTGGARWSGTKSSRAPPALARACG